MWGHIERSSNKMLYARTANTLAADTNQSTSVCFPVSAIRGIAFSSGTLVVIRFESPFQYVSSGDDDCDLVLLVISSGEHKTFMNDLTKEIAFGDNYLIVLGDNVTSEHFTGVGLVNGITANVGAD